MLLFQVCSFTIIFLRQQRNSMITIALYKENRKPSLEEIKICAGALIAKYPMMEDKEKLAGRAPVSINIEKFSIATNVTNVYSHKHDFFLTRNNTLK